MVAAQSSPVSGFVSVVAVLASAPKISPESVAAQVFDAVEAGELIYPPIQEFWDAAVSGTS
jgi:hypothetical protein